MYVASKWLKDKEEINDVILIPVEAARECSCHSRPFLNQPVSSNATHQLLCVPCTEYRFLQFAKSSFPKTI